MESNAIIINDNGNVYGNNILTYPDIKKRIDL